MNRIENFCRYILLFGLLPLLVVQCSESEEPIIDPNPIIPVNIPEGDGFALLSEYNFFNGNITELDPNTKAGVLPYDLNTPLFSDYASKKRFIYVPEGSSIPFDTSQVLDLPVGSVLIKHFYYPKSAGEDQYIETRLLINRTTGWQPETYEWNADKTDAQRTVIGGTRQLTVEANGIETTFNYLIPNQNQCKNCHAFDGEIKPIGPTIHNLNKDYSYEEGWANQITTWVSNGILESPAISNIPKFPMIDDENSSLDNRARAYLSVNCSSCHRREGSAANSGLYLEYHNTIDSSSIGFWKTPVAAGDGSGGFTYVINPGKSDQSILLYRMISDEVDERMPEIGRELIDDEGVALIREWIDGF